MSIKGAPKKPTGSALREMRLARELQRVDPAEEARRREGSLLRSLGAAREDFDWLLANQAWTLLGFGTLADWWAERIQPVAEAMNLRAAPDLARRVIDRIREDEAELPPTQRRTKTELAELVGVHRDTVSGRKRQDHPGAEVPRGSDLDGPAEIVDPLSTVPAAAHAVDQFLANQNTDSPADPPLASDMPEVPVVAISGQPEQAPEEPANLLGGSDEPPSSGSSDAQPPTESGVSQVRDEPEDGTRQPSSGALKPKRPVETEEEQAARERMEFRTARSLEFAEGLVNLTQRLDDDAVSWFQEVYLLGVYPHRDLPTVRDCFTPPSMRALAEQLGVLADYLEETGEVL